MGGARRISQKVTINAYPTLLNQRPENMSSSSRDGEEHQSTNTAESAGVPVPLKTGRYLSKKRHGEETVSVGEAAQESQSPGSDVQTAPGNGNNPQKVTNIATRYPSEQEVVAAIESLYDDQVKPLGRIVRKRLAEHLERVGESADGLDTGCIRSVCEASEQFVVETEIGGEWSATLLNRESTFTNFYSTEDPYPEALWSEAAAYFGGLSGEGSILPGGRYACATALMQRGLPFLIGRSLGQICHIVQLALGPRKILGYLNGAVAPYGQSRSFIKDIASAKQSSYAAASRRDSAPKLQIADRDTARACLIQILRGAASGGKDYVPLSNIKRIFRMRFQMELCETMFGHARLSELLQSEPFRDICRVQLIEQGYVVYPEGQATNSAGSNSSANAEPQEDMSVIEEEEGEEEEEGPAEATAGSAPAVQSGWHSSLPPINSEDSALSCTIHNTFIHVFEPPPSPFGSASRSNSVPKTMSW